MLKLNGYLWYNDSDSKENNMKINARKLALRILDEIDASKDFSHIVLNRTLAQFEVEPLDRRFASQLVFGVLENKLLLDYYIRKLSKVRFSRIDSTLVNILRLGLYQLAFLNKIPDSAAVNESVKLAKKLGPREANSANGLLRTFVRGGCKIDLPDENKHPVTALSIKYSHPEWLVEMWLNAYGFAFTQQLLKANNATPSLTLRTQTLLISTEELAKKLTEQGVICEAVSWMDEGIVIKSLNHLSIADLVGYDDGWFQVQDLSSMCVGKYAGVKPNDLVVDVCAAPGGKSSHVAQLMGDKGKVIARDLIDEKCDLIKENINRLKLNAIVVEKFDARLCDETLIQKADVVLVDAPCSGLGIIRRKPDIKYNKTLEQLAELERIQTEILDQAAKYVKINGCLMYSTCTLNPKENQEIIKSFLVRDDAFEIEALPSSDEEGFLTFFPHQHGTDGFFIAKLKRIR